MRRVRLILPVVDASAVTAERVVGWRRSLETAGDRVDVVAVLASAGPAPGAPESGAWRWLSAGSPGLVSAVIAGLTGAGDLADAVLILDPTSGFAADDLPALADAVTCGKADLAVARRREVDPGGTPGGCRRRAGAGVMGRLARPIVGVSDPWSGLAAVAPGYARELAGVTGPVGSRFAADLLVRAGRGRRVEVLARAAGPPPRRPVDWDDLRHLKRLADDRLGNASRLIQFCAVGASGTAVDLSCYAAFQWLFSRTGLAGRSTPMVGRLDLAAAGAMAIGLALCWNFALNRRLTFSYARRGSIGRQFLAYALGNALGVALSLTLRLALPANVGFFDRHRLAAAAVGIVTATGISFTTARWFAFGRQAMPAPRPESLAVAPAAGVARS